MLVAALSLGCLICGVGLAVRSLRDPVRAATFERRSGICIVLGLCLLGVALQSGRWGDGGRGTPAAATCCQPARPEAGASTQGVDP